MSLDYPNYEKMKRECPDAARYWRIGDALYYIGLLPAVVTLALAGLLRSGTLLITSACGAAVWVAGMYVKGRAYRRARKAGCTFDD